MCMCVSTQYLNMRNCTEPRRSQFAQESRPSHKFQTWGVNTFIQKREYSWMLFRYNYLCWLIVYKHCCTMSMAGDKTKPLISGYTNTQFFLLQCFSKHTHMAVKHGWELNEILRYCLGNHVWSVCIWCVCVCIVCLPSGNPLFVKEGSVEIT